MPHLIVDISSHGYGHAGQLAPILADLSARTSDLRVTIRSAHKTATLATFFAFDFTHATPPPDIGLVMHGPLDVDVEASKRHYDALEAQIEPVIEKEAAALASLGGDLLLSNIGFVGPCAAKKLDLRSVALCSLNWADIGAHYRVMSDALVQRVRDAYESSLAFLQPTPHMPMAWLSNARPIGPLARIGRERRAELTRRLGVPQASFLVLVSFGGIAGPVASADLPPIEGVTFLADVAARKGCVSVGELGFAFIDLVASVDLVLTKSGYGLFVEPAANGARVLYVDRKDWPEAPFLERWIEEVGIGTPAPATSEDLVTEIKRLRDLPAPAVIEPTGVAEASRFIETLLRSPTGLP